MINNVRAYSKVIDNKVRVFLSYEDVLNRLGLITYNQIPNQKIVTDINGKDQYGHEILVDWSKINIYAAIGNLVNQDPSITQCIPVPLSTSNYIPSELAVELARQCGNKGFEMELIQQIVPALDGSNAINSAMALRSQIENRQSIQQQYSFRPTPDNPFQGNVNDLNNAYRIYYKYKDSIRYIQDWDQFLIYESIRNQNGSPIGGGIWRIANEGQLKNMINQLEAELNQMAKNDKEREVAQAFSDVSYINRAISQIKGINECTISSFQLNRFPDLLNVLNGVINLKTGELMPANPGLYLTQQAPVMYNIHARSPFFEQFIMDILPDPDTREAVLRYLGYCLTGETNAQKALFIIGSGANGKSTLLNVISRLLGFDYSASVPITFFSEHSLRSKSGPTPERAMLIGKRFIQVDEIKAGEVLDAGEFKLLTGSDMIPFRDMYKNMDIFSPTHKFIFSGNFLPELKNNNDGGLNRRLMVAEFPRKFNQNQCNPYLLNMLTTPESLSGILNILVQQAIQYYQHRLYESAAMMDVRNEYISGLTKIVKSVLKSKYINDLESYVLVSDLEREINRTIFPNELRQGQLKQIMHKLGYHPIKITRAENRNKWAYQGLKFINK